MKQLGSDELGFTHNCPIERKWKFNTPVVEAPSSVAVVAGVVIATSGVVVFCGSSVVEASGVVVNTASVNKKTGKVLVITVLCTR